MLLTGVVLSCLILASMPVVMSDDDENDRYGGYAKEKTGREKAGMGPGPENIYMTVTHSGTMNDTSSFMINNIAMKGKENTTTVFAFNTPLQGTYNTTSDMGYISTINAIPATATYDTIANSSIPVAGASMVIGFKDINKIAKERGYHIAEVGNIAVFLPDGSVKPYTLDQPIRITHNEDRNLIVIDAYPSFTKRMSDDLGNATATFPAGTAPVKINGLEVMWTSVTPAPISYDLPRYIAPPA